MPAYDPRSPSVVADPYPAYRRLHADGGVEHLPAAGLWFVAGYADCLAALRDRRLSAAGGQRLRARRDRLPASMLTADPPEHGRLRRAAAPAFTPAGLAPVRRWLPPLVDAGLDALVAGLAGDAPVDVVGDFARPLAARTLGRFLGLPDGELPAFVAWADAVAANLDPFADPAEDGAAARAMAQMLDRFADHLHARLLGPAEGPIGHGTTGDSPAGHGTTGDSPAGHGTTGDGLTGHGTTGDALGVLAGAYRAGQLTAGEVLSTAGLLVVGGVEPLADMIGNAVAALLSGRADRPGGCPLGLAGARAGTALEETLRFDPPIPFTARTATEDLPLAGHTVRRGESVVVLLGAANHDPGRFARPDVLALDRSGAAHLAFGAGPHACLGAPLARLFGRAVLAGLRERLPPVVLDAGAVRRSAAVPRGYLRLPVRRAGPP